jgi:GH43 family beta-xylosidase
MKGVKDDMKRRPLIILLLSMLIVNVISGCFSGPQDPQLPSSNQFYNPIKNIGNDPWVMFYDDHYYLAESWDGGIWIWKSPYKSLTGIESEGTKVKVFSYPESGPNCSPAWAPELHFIDDKWYIYYAASTCDKALENHRMFVLESDRLDPQGSYTDKGQITDSTDKWAIDGSVLHYDDQMYFIWSGWPGDTNGIQNNYIAPMSNPWTISGDRILLSTPTYSWEKMGGDGSPNAPYINEGPTALIKSGSNTVNIVYSASGSWTDDYGYGLLTNTSGDMLDPDAWGKSPSLVFSKTSEVFGPGHGSFVKSPDGTEDWMVYHAARYSGSGWDRMMYTQKFTWNDDDTPKFGTPVSPHVRQDVPSGEPVIDVYGWGDSASGTALFGNWKYISEDSAQNHSLGSGLRHVFKGDLNSSNYTVSADVKWLESGSVTTNPKYGIYATYQDSNNYVMAMIEPFYGLLSTYGVVGGTVEDWSNVPLPAGSIIAEFNELKIVKEGSTYHFYVNGELLQSRNFEINEGQIGLVTEDTRAIYENVRFTINK